MDEGGGRMSRLEVARRDLESIVSKINNHVYAPGQLQVVVMRHADAQDILRVAFDLLDLVERAVPYIEILRDNQFDVDEWLTEVQNAQR
jgi:hypothetical protein